MQYINRTYYGEDLPTMFRNLPEYNEFLKNKQRVKTFKGVKKTCEINPILFDFQKDTVELCLEKGRFCIFYDCGLGKTYIQLEIAKQIEGTTLIVCPLFVIQQTEKIASEVLNIELNNLRENDFKKGVINIINYESLKHYEEFDIDCVILDESSILKDLASKTQQYLQDRFMDTKYKFCFSATPSPNDIIELNTHCEFMGIASRKELLSMFFMHDKSAGAQKNWKLKGHAVKAFWDFVSEWAFFMTTPTQLGYNETGKGYNLPKLNIKYVGVETKYKQDGYLFATKIRGITDRSQIRKSTIDERVKKSLELINSNNEQWIVWVGLNEEGNRLHKLLKDSIEISGQDKDVQKVEKFKKFLNKEVKVLITKPTIAGHGINLQSVNNMIFLGLSDSYEQYYQSIRRCWRYGQKKPVGCYIVLSHLEKPIYDNVLRKENEAKKLIEGVVESMKNIEERKIHKIEEVKEVKYLEPVIEKDYTLYNGDCIEIMKTFESESIDFSVFSPPFSSLFTYTDKNEDLGNCKDEEFTMHFYYFVRELYRVLKPGRVVALHIQNLKATKVHDGYIGTKDLRGDIIRIFEQCFINETKEKTWVYDGEVTIAKNPQTQAIRNHDNRLLFLTLKKDSSHNSQGFADYILKFKKSGENEIPIRSGYDKDINPTGEITTNEWIKWANPCWTDIREMDVLNFKEARSEKDEKHVCPLQLEVIKRCVLLWSNPHEIVFSPFAGIGSELYVALQHNRKALGIELKEEYFKQSIKNCNIAVNTREEELSLF